MEQERIMTMAEKVPAQLGKEFLNKQTNKQTGCVMLMSHLRNYLSLEG
jgi:hypothetical protein